MMDQGTTTIVIMGANGDLTKRKLMPALFNLRHKPESTEGRPWGQPLKKLEGAPVNLG